MEVDSSNSIAILSFDEGGEYPRLTRSLMVELSDLIDGIQRELAFRGVVIAANSKSFATGAELEEIVPLEGVAAWEFARRGQTLFEKIARLPLPVIAAIRGYCMGGGFDLALACHQRVATYDSAFSHPGASLGLLTGWGGTQRLPRLIGKSAAIQILLTGERIPATQALTLGLVDELVLSRELIDAAVRRATQLSAQRSLPGRFDDSDFESPGRTDNHPNF